MSTKQLAVSWVFGHGQMAKVVDPLSKEVDPRGLGKRIEYKLPLLGDAIDLVRAWGTYQHNHDAEIGRGDWICKNGETATMNALTHANHLSRCFGIDRVELMLRVTIPLEHVTVTIILDPTRDGVWDYPYSSAWEIEQHRNGAIRAALNMEACGSIFVDVYSLNHSLHVPVRMIHDAFLGRDSDPNDIEFTRFDDYHWNHFHIGLEKSDTPETVLAKIRALDRLFQAVNGPLVRLHQAIVKKTEYGQRKQGILHDLARRPGTAAVTQALSQAGASFDEDIQKCQAALNAAFALPAVIATRAFCMETSCRSNDED